MKKYLVLASQVFSKWTTYRFSMLAGIAQSFITPLIMILALKAANPISNVRLSELLPYYLVISFVYSIVRSDVDDVISDYTDSGEINNFLVKPLSLCKYLITQELSQGIITGLIILIFVITYQLFNGSLVVNPLYLVLVLTSLAMAFVIYFSFSYLIGLFCFWVEQFWSIHNLKFVMIQFLGGIVLPYSFFPDQLRIYLAFTPFPYMISWVRDVIGGQFSLFQFSIAFCWILIILCLTFFLEKIAINKYSATAG